MTFRRAALKSGGLEVVDGGVVHLEVLRGHCRTVFGLGGRVVGVRRAAASTSTLGISIDSPSSSSRQPLLVGVNLLMVATKRAVSILG
jgi:hypothetical protein